MGVLFKIACPIDRKFVDFSLFVVVEDVSVFYAKEKDVASDFYVKTAVACDFHKFIGIVRFLIFCPPSESLRAFCCFVHS